MVALIALGMLIGCGADPGVLTDEETSDLVERVLADLDLPGDQHEPPFDPADIPEGELEFGFQCQIKSAGFDVDQVLVAFPPAAVGHEENGRVIERVEVSILVFDTPASASAVLAAYDDEGTIDCLSRTFSESVLYEADDPLEAGGVTAEGMAFKIGTGEIQPEGHRTFATTFGRILIDVTVLAPAEGRGRELAARVLEDVVSSLRAGGALVTAGRIVPT